MEISYNLTIRKVTLGTSGRFGPFLVESDFLRLYELARGLNVWRGDPDIPKEICTIFHIKCRDDGSEFRSVTGFLAACGWDPYYGFTPPELQKTHYSPRIQREWDSADLDSAEFLLLTGWGSDLGPVAWFAGYRGGQFVGVAESVGTSIPAAWDDPFGYGDGHRDLLVHPRVKGVLEDELKGCRFVPVEWDRPDLAKGGFWKLTSDVVMPPCQTKLVLTGNEWRFEEGGYIPAQLIYRRAEVQALGTFDVARTHEIIGETAEDRPNYRGRLLIVSQRFREITRQFLTREDLRIDFHPVKLI